MIIENRVLIDKTKATSLAKITRKNRRVLRIDVMGRAQEQLPGSLSSIRLVFFDASENILKEVDFLRGSNAFQVVLLPTFNFIINTDFCSIAQYNGEILDNEDVYLFYDPPLSFNH